MKKEIHPAYYMAKVECSCGNKFTVGATVESFRLEVCSACHPFYSGQIKYVDTARRVDRFQSQLEKSQQISAARNRQAKQ